MILKQFYKLSISLMPSSVSREDFQLFIANKQKPLVVKFTADWCGPCKRIKPVVDEQVKILDDKIIYMEIDVDESFDVYATMKSKRMLSGIPTLMFYALDNKEFYPSLTTTGGNIDTVKGFFQDITNRVS